MHFGATDLTRILDIRGFDLYAILGREPDFLEGVGHVHDDAITSFVSRATRPFIAEKLEDFMGAMIDVVGQDMLRYKGVLQVRESTLRLVFQGVHMMVGFDTGKAWRSDETPASVLLFIGRHVPEQLFRDGFEGCLQRL